MSTKTPSKTAFKGALEPFFEMLEEKERTMPRDQWLQLVASTKERINNAPEQYLGGSVHPSFELQQAIDTIFQERLN